MKTYTFKQQNAEGVVGLVFCNEPDQAEAPPSEQPTEAAENVKSGAH